jgi:7-keto-8-aminopelargonate synthetase-like enzyme
MASNVVNNLTSEDQIKRQREAYGCTQEELIEIIKQNVRFISSTDMLVGSMISDVQEMLERMGDDAERRERYKEMARQTLNRAKFILFNPDIMRVIFEDSKQ